jgi:hypothetical protein
MCWHLTRRGHIRQGECEAGFRPDFENFIRVAAEKSRAGGGTKIVLGS